MIDLGTENKKPDNLMMFGPSSSPASQPLTPFAPYYEVPMWNCNINLNGTLMDNLRYYLLTREVDILMNLDYHSDGGTGLGEHSVTTRFAKYNLFTFADPSISILKNMVKKEYNKFMNAVGAHKTQSDFFLNKMYYEPYIACWFNVLRKGENIKKHMHSNQGNAFISGNICVSAENTETHYEMPYEQGVVQVENTPGNLVFFPSYLSHWTTKNESDQPRVSIVFDIYAKKEHILMSENGKELIKTAVEFTFD